MGMDKDMWNQMAGILAQAAKTVDPNQRDVSDYAVQMNQAQIMERELERQRKEAKKQKKGSTFGKIGSTIGSVVGSVGGPVGSAAGSAIGGAAGRAVGGADITAENVIGDAVSGGVSGGFAKGLNTQAAAQAGAQNMALDAGSGAMGAMPGGGMIPIAASKAANVGLGDKLVNGLLAQSPRAAFAMELLKGDQKNGAGQKSGKDSMNDLMMMALLQGGL